MNTYRNAALRRQAQMLDSIAARGYLAGHCVIGDEWRQIAIDEAARARLLNTATNGRRATAPRRLRQAIGAAFVGLGVWLRGSTNAAATTPPTTHAAEPC